MNYRKIYDDLIDKRKRTCPEDGDYCELHHIVPKCLGGTNCKNNLVKLTAREHFLAHVLLAKSYSSSNDVDAARRLRASVFASGMIKNGRQASRRYAKMKKIEFGCLSQEASKVSKFMSAHGRMIVESDVETKIFSWSDLKEVVFAWFSCRCIDVETVNKMTSFFRLMSMEFSCGLAGFLKRNNGRNREIYSMFGNFA